MNGKFLHEECKTEQLVSGIEYKEVKACLCPQCGQICCADYCVVHKNGKWNMNYVDDLNDFRTWTKNGYVDNDLDPYKEAEKENARRYEVFKVSYEETKREYGLL